MTITFSVGTLLSFLANRRLTFKHRGNQFGALGRFLVAYAILWLVNFIALQVFVGYLKFPHQIVQACVILVLILLAFLSQKLWVFRAANDADAAQPKATRPEK